MNGNQWRIGDVKITRLIEIEMAGGLGRIIPDARRERLLGIPWLRPHFIDEVGRMIASIHMFVIETPDRRIIVDTCVGNDKPREAPAWNLMQTKFMDDFAAAGFRTDAIDNVLCTHLHIDHVGWNTMLRDGQWVPTFPNARYLYGKTEFEHWRAAESTPDGGRENLQIMADSVLPVWEAGLVDLVATDHRICPEVRLISTPGHTPGHVSVMIESQGASAFITGDFLHHPCQFAHPQWCSNFDHHREQAVATRIDMFGKLADGPTLVLGTHFASPTAGHLKRDGEAWRFEV